MTVVNYSVQETFGNNRFFFEGVKWFDEVHALRPLPRRAEAPAAVHRHRTRDRDTARRGDRARDAAQGRVGVGVPGADVDAAADPVERRRRDVEHLRAARHRPARLDAQRDGHRLQLHAAAGRRVGDADRDGRLALDFARRAARLRRPQRHPGRLLPGGEDRRRVGVGGVPPRPAAEDEARADDRGAAAVHGQLHDLHRAVRADRRRTRATRRRCCRSTWSRSRSGSSTSARRRRCR